MKNVEIADRTGLPSKRRQALFGHVVRLDATTPAHQALWQVIAMKGGQSMGMIWRRLPGRSRKAWRQQIGNGTPASWRQTWQSTDERGHRGESSQRTSAVYPHDDDDDNDDDAIARLYSSGGSTGLSVWLQWLEFDL